MRYSLLLHRKVSQKTDTLRKGLPGIPEWIAGRPFCSCWSMVNIWISEAYYFAKIGENLCTNIHIRICFPPP